MIAKHCREHPKQSPVQPRIPVPALSVPRYSSFTLFTLRPVWPIFAFSFFEFLEIGHHFNIAVPLGADNGLRLFGWTCKHPVDVARIVRHFTRLLSESTTVGIRLHTRNRPTLLSIVDHFYCTKLHRNGERPVSCTRNHVPE